MTEAPRGPGLAEARPNRNRIEARGGRDPALAFRMSLGSRTPWCARTEPTESTEAVGTAQEVANDVRSEGLSVHRNACKGEPW